MIISSSSACNPNATLPTVGSQYRCQQPLDPTICTTIKNRGIRIAILYTEYLQLPTDSWYNSRHSCSSTTLPPRPVRSTESAIMRIARPVRRRSNRRRHLGSADEPVHQSRVKYRQPHAVRKTPWPKLKSHREKNTAIVAPVYQGQKGRHGGRVRAGCRRHFSPLSSRSFRRFSFSLRRNCSKSVVQLSSRQILTGQVQSQQTDPGRISTGRLRPGRHPFHLQWFDGRRAGPHFVVVSKYICSPR